MPPEPTRANLDGLIGRLARRLSVQIWLHGLGTVAALTVAWLAFAFLADWVLHVPAGVRWIHLAILFLLPVLVLRRELLRPLSRRPDGSGLAVMIERAHPGLKELLVSAVQLARRPNGSPELVARVQEEAEQRARGIGLRDVLDERSPRRRAAVGFASVAALAFLAFASPEHSLIFAKRLLGGDVPWPQRTWLAVSIPLLSERAWIEIEGPEDSPEAIDVRVARGTDVPVLVEAEGVVPDSISLRFSGGQEMLVPATGGASFRTMLRSCQEDCEFRVTGGDDRRGRPVVRVQVLEPPDVAGLVVQVEPPAYSGLSRRSVRDSDVEVLAGSKLTIVMRPDPPEAIGSVHRLPDGEVIELAPRSFPGELAEGEPTGGLGFELLAEKSVRYRFELQDDSGLTNPSPGLYAVDVAPDRDPELWILSPGRSEVHTTSRGLIPLRVRARDDFGLVEMVWTAVPAGSPDARPAGSSLEIQEVPPAEGTPRGLRVFSAGARIEVSQLAADGRGAEPGSQYALEVVAVDNAPDPGLTASTPLHVRIVSDEELLRRLQDRLAEVRAQVGSLETLSAEKGRRTGELLAGLEGDDLADLPGRELFAVLTGARRVQGDAEAVAREVSAIVETVLYARLDDKAAGLLEHLDQSKAQLSDRRFHPEVWVELAAAHREGRLGTPGFAGELVEILDLGLEIAETDARGVVEALDLAAQVADVSTAHEHLIAAAALQADLQTHVEQLLERLAEWDNYQSILSLTRDILNRQRSLRERTRQYAKDR